MNVIITLVISCYSSSLVALKLRVSKPLATSLLRVMVMLGNVRNRHFDASRLQDQEHQPWMLSPSEFSLMLAMSGSLLEFMETSLPDLSLSFFVVGVLEKSSFITCFLQRF